MTRALLLAALVATGVAQSVGAQGAAPAIAQFRPQQRIRVSVDGHRVTGRLGGTEAGDIWINSAADRRRIPMTRIDTLWRRGNAAGTGALVGGLIGAVASTAFLHVIVNITCEGSSTCARDHRRAWAYGIIGGGALGAAAGAGTGALIGRWRRVAI